MSKIAEKRVKELGYFKDPLNRQEFTANDIFDCGVECYDQAMQDMARDADRLQYLSDEFGYAYACGCEKTMQDFMEKAESFLENKVSDYFWWNNDECFVEFDKEECIKEFKRYVQDEIQN